MWVVRASNRAFDSDFATANFYFSCIQHFVPSSMFRTFPTTFTLGRACLNIPIGRVSAQRSPVYVPVAWRSLPSSNGVLQQRRKISTPPQDEPKPVEKAPVPPSKSVLGQVDFRSDVYTIPNILTMTRIATTPFIGYFIATGHSTAAVSLFVYSCVTDFVDGQIARRFNMKSVLGSVLDPAADKFLMTVSTVALASQSIMPLYVGVIIIGRDVLLSFMGFFYRYRALPEPKTMKRFLDLSISTHTVHPSLLGKANTALQMFYIGGLVMLPGIEYVIGGSSQVGQFFDWFGMAVALTTASSGLGYIFSRSAVKAVR